MYQNKDGFFTTLEKKRLECSTFEDKERTVIEMKDATYGWYKFEYHNLIELELYVAIGTKNDLHRIGIFDMCINEQD